MRHFFSATLAVLILFTFAGIFCPEASARLDRAEKERLGWHFGSVERDECTLVTDSGLPRALVQFEEHLREGAAFQKFGPRAGPVLLSSQPALRVSSFFFELCHSHGAGSFSARPEMGFASHPPHAPPSRFPI